MFFILIKLTSSEKKKLQLIEILKSRFGYACDECIYYEGYPPKELTDSFTLILNENTTTTSTPITTTSTSTSETLLIEQFKLLEPFEQTEKSQFKLSKILDEVFERVIDDKESPTIGFDARFSKIQLMTPRYGTKKHVLHHGKNLRDVIHKGHIVLVAQGIPFLESAIAFGKEERLVAPDFKIQVDDDITIVIWTGFKEDTTVQVVNNHHSRNDIHVLCK